MLKHFAEDFKNQIIFTTHSPFMIPEITSVRTVNIDRETKTTVTTDPTGDSKTLFPIQSAMGYALAQSLFIDEFNLVIEGVTDYWYLSSISDFLNETKGNGLTKKLVLTPAGGAQKVPYMVALLTSQELKVMVLLDDEGKGREAAEDMIKSKLIRENYITFVTAGFLSQPPKEADIEDLLEPDVFDILAKESYKKELLGKTLTLNPKIPRIVRRYEEAFEKIGLEFFKSRVAKLFIQKMATDPTSVLGKQAIERFETLLKILGDKIEKLEKSNHTLFR